MNEIPAGKEKCHIHPMLTATKSWQTVQKMPMQRVTIRCKKTNIGKNVMDS